MESIATPTNPFVVDGALAVPSFEQWFFLPGDWSIYWLASRAPAVAELLGLGPGDYGSPFAGFFAWLMWLAFAIALIAAAATVRRFDRAVTRRLVDGVAELKRRIRMALVVTQYRRRRRADRKEPTFDGEEPTLSPDEVRALELHARLAPGFALAVSDVAEELHARVYEVHGVLERLQRLQLLKSTVGGLDGETAYTLTSAGRALARLHRPRPSVA
jgi:hypothetical protein